MHCEWEEMHPKIDIYSPLASSRSAFN